MQCILKKLQIVQLDYVLVFEFGIHELSLCVFQPIEPVLSERLEPHLLLNGHRHLAGVQIDDVFEAVLFCHLYHLLLQSLNNRLKQGYFKSTKQVVHWYYIM